MKPRIALAALTIVLGLVLLACGGQGTGPGNSADSEAAISEGDVAPDFSLPDADGGTTSLLDFRRSKAVLLYFSMGSG
jgi:cytochrome oxidase Cu insertion factor (SCO1/SenC/PrrC family)